MKKTLITIVYTGILLICNFAIAEQLTVDSAKNYPYKNLIDRTDDVKVFYTTNNKNFTCRVEVKLDQMKWATEEKKINKAFFSHDPLANCLSRESAEQILLQSFLQFGRGL